MLSQRSPTPDSLVREIAGRLPRMPSIRADEVIDPTSHLVAGRIAFDVGLVHERVPPQATVVDVGGGLGMFAAAMAALGAARSILVDDHFDFRELPIWGDLQAVWEHYGVEVEVRDVLREGMGDINEVDAITAFHVVEHLHNSPRAFFRDAVSRLKPGGVLVIAVPNAANLRKRIAIPLKGSAATAFGYWYDEPVFRGHVREPVVADLLSIATDLGLNAEILGRNFLGLGSPVPWRKRAAQLADSALQRRPSLCSEIYLVGTKP